MAENRRKFGIRQFLLWTIGAVLISVLFFVLAVDKKNPAAFVVICCFMEAAAMGLCFISLKGKNYSGLHFSALVALMLFLIYAPIYFNGQIYIYLDIGADTYAGNWCSYIFLSDFWDHLQSGWWSFSIGLGNNLFVFADHLFDPFNLVLYLFRQDYFVDGIFAAALAKYAATAFFAYQFYTLMGFSGPERTMASLAHTFSGFMVGWGQHYFFATAFAEFTMLMWGFELYQRKKIWLPFLVSVFLLGIFSAYFLYISLLFLALYALLRFFTTRQCNAGKSSLWRRFWKYVWHCLWPILLGMGAAMWSFLPQVFNLLNNPRVNGNKVWDFSWINAAEWYTLLCRFLSNGLLGIHEFVGIRNFYEAPCVYTGIFTLFALVAALSVKEYRSRKKFAWIAFFIVSTLLVPHVFNILFNALSTDSYRWYYAMVPLFCLGTACGVRALRRPGVGRYALIFAGIPITLFLIWFILSAQSQFTGELLIETSVQSTCIAGLTLIGLMIAMCWADRKGLTRAAAGFLLFVLMFDLTGNAFVTVNTRSLLPRSVLQTSEYFDSSSDAIQWIETQDNGFYRISKTYAKVDLNDSLVQNYYSEKLYRPFIQRNFGEFIQEFSLKMPSSNYLYGFDGAQDLRNQAGVKYLLTHAEDAYAGYTQMGQVEDVYIYRNDNALPLGYCVSGYFTRDQADEMSAYEKQLLFYSSALVEEESALFQSMENDTKPAVSLNVWEAASSVTEEDVDVRLQETSEDTLALTFMLNQGDDEKQLLQIRCFDANDREMGENPLEVLVIGNEGTVTLPYIGISRIEISFPNAQTDVLELLNDVTVSSRNDEELRALTQEIQENALQIQEFRDSRITGIAETDHPAILKFSIPYESGWKVTVDGESQELLLVDTTYLGVYLEPGIHQIELSYHSVTFQTGVLISIVCILLILFRFIHHVIVLRRKQYEK